MRSPSYGHARYWLGVIVLLALALSMGRSTANPDADFEGRVGMAVAFNVTIDPGGPVDLYSWDFNGSGTDDWSSPVGPNTTHVYDEAGMYSAVLRADLSNGTSLYWTFSVRVDPQNLPPVVTALKGPTGSIVTDRLTPVELSGAAADADGHVVLYEWDFDGDGTFDWSSAGGSLAIHTFDRLGNFTTVLRATDDGGASGEDSVRVEVRNLPPSVVAPGDLTTDSGQVNLTVTASDVDGTIAAYTWDFGDGTDPLTTELPNATHEYLVTARYTVRVTVVDGDGGTSSAVLWVNVIGVGPEPPRVDAGEDIETLVGETVEFEAVVVVGSAPLKGCRWDLDGDGEWDAEECEATHVYLVEGTYTATVEVWDENDILDRDTLHVVVNYVANDPPVAVPSVEQWVRPGRGLEFSEASYDPDGRIVLYQWDFDGDGRFDHSDPESGNATWVYHEEDIYLAELRVTDNRGEVASATVSISVSRDAPGEDGIDDSKGAAVCCAVLVIVLVLSSYWAMRRSLATPRRDGGPAVRPDEDAPGGGGGEEGGGSVVEEGSAPEGETPDSDD